jgi:hypothetical protein
MKIIAESPRARGKKDPEPLQPIQTDPTPPPKTEFTQAELRTYDFTGWDWNLLPHGVVKSARNGGVPGHTVIARIECLECKRPIWTCDPKREDLCEEDDYLLRSRNWDLRSGRAKRNNLKPLNPFAQSDEKPNKIFWPLDE